MKPRLSVAEARDFHIKSAHVYCKKHPRYMMVLKPSGNCHDCWFAWFYKQGREYFGW